MPAERVVRMIGLDIRDEDVVGVADVLRSGMLVQGPEVQRLEQRFAARVGVRHAIAVNSGTAALHCMLASLDLRPGDEVVTTALSFAATANMILAAGAVPRFADVDEHTFNLSPRSLSERLSPKTRGILTVDLYGRLADYETLAGVAGAVPVFADACQAVGAVTARGQQAGSLARASAFSLYATKNWQCGEGGMVTTDDDALAAFARRFRHHGQEPGGTYDYRHLGFNYRMTDFVARFAATQLELLDEGNARRRHLASLYAERLHDVAGVQLPGLPRAGHVFHQLTIRAERRDELRRALSDAGIATQVYYPRPLTDLPHLGEHPDRGRVPVARRLCAEVVSLPIHTRLSDDDVEYVAERVRAFYR
jgi:dTDP-4-amino-4,6-dideoxygalactose transaminase